MPYFQARNSMYRNANYIVLTSPQTSRNVVETFPLGAKKTVPI